MRIKRKFVDLWKRILLITFCIVAMTGLTGCEKNNVQERATDTYVMKHKDAVDKRSMDTSGRLADAAEKSYYDSLDKLTKQGGGLDTSSWEGDDAIDKWSRRIMYWWTCFYRAAAVGCCTQMVGFAATGYLSCRALYRSAEFSGGCG